MNITVTTTGSGAVPILALRPDEAAKAIGVSRSTLDRLTRDGEIRCKRDGRVVVYSLKALQAWRDQQKQIELERETAKKASPLPPDRSTEKVYFLFDPVTREIKIGKTFGDPKERWRNLRCGNPRLEFIGFVVGKESDFHARFALLRASGEFFAMGEPLVSFVREAFPDFKEDRP